MKSYLDLADIQARVHRRQNRMTVFCIALAVFLVTGVFSMADMEVCNQTERAKIDHGNWHIMIHDVPEEEAERVLGDYAVETSAWYDVVNCNLDRDYTIMGRNVCIAGISETFEEIALTHRYAEGSFPSSDKEIEISENMRRQFGLGIGDSVKIVTPAGEYEYIISGFLDDTAGLLREDACGVFMNRNAFDGFCRANGEKQNPVLYVRFRNILGIRKTISQLKKAYGWDENIAENSAVLGIMGMSSNDYITGLYGAAAALMLLVILAGVLMISGSMNSSIIERTQYFGMLRCIGAGKRQIRHLVRREALNWCMTAIPAGEAVAVLGVWIICAVLHYGIGGEWELFPVFRISLTGIVTGALIGVVTVLFAANSPSRKAAAVSPVEAVSANASGSLHAGTGARTDGIRIDTALGINHAFSGRRNIVLMTGSFALSILLFLTFSVMIDWIGHALNTTKPYSQDMSVYCDGYERELPKGLADRIGGVQGVKLVYGRMHLNCEIGSEKDVGRIDLISYESLQFKWAGKELLCGDMDKVTDGDGLITVYGKDNPLELGDIIRINGKDAKIEAVLSDSPFSPDGTPVIICSEDTFTEITGKDGYAVIDIQVFGDSDEQTVSDIRSVLDRDMRLSDVSKDKREANNTYLAFSILVYGFLSVIAMITVVNIINSISMSVSARSRQYGIMRAIGMDDGQIRKMISSEALSYAASGCIAGCVIGLPLNAVFYRTVISSYWGDPWRFPAAELAIILAVVLFSAFIAAKKPSDRIAEMTVVNVLSAQ